MSQLIHIPENGSLVPKQSKSNFPTLSSWINELFDRDLNQMWSTSNEAQAFIPQVNIKETADAYTVEMAAPGLKKSDFEIDIEHQVLSISANQEKKKEEDNEKYTRKEFAYTSFKRSFNLPETIAEDKIKAQYSEGILSIVLPKKDEAKQQPPRRIKIS